MTTLGTEINRGLEGVVVGETAISQVDGIAGRLVYRGYLIGDLVEHCTYPQVAGLILSGEIPNEAETRALEQAMLAQARLNPGERALFDNLPLDRHPMTVLQGILPLLDLEGGDFPEAYSEDAARGLVAAAKLTWVVAGYARRRKGLEPLETDASLSWLGNFLWLLHGEVPSDDAVRTLDATQILQADHGFNASAFSLRVTASTLAPLSSAVSSAIGTLYGPLHGGADEMSLRMALKIGSPEAAEAFVLDCLARKEKIMGMGHRVYKVVDPRAKILKPMAEALCAGTDAEAAYRTLAEIERVMQREMEKKGKAIYANVEFYKGAVLNAVGIPLEFFTSMFAISRVPGYVAHFIESRVDNRIIRPKAAYVGPDYRSI